MPTVLGRYMHQELELDLIILPSFIVWDINLITGTTLNDRPSFFFFESAFKVHCVLAPVSDWGKNPLSQAWSNFIFLMENYIAHGSAWSLCVLVKPASRAPRGLFFCLSSAFVVWNVQVVHAHLQICLLHKSLSFSIVVMGGGWEGGVADSKKSTVWAPPQLPRCPALWVFLI